MRWGARTIVGISCGLAALAAPSLAGISSAIASASPPQVRLGELPRLPAHAAALGGLPGATRMHITVALKVRDPGSVAAYARAVSTPDSAFYRQYLTPARFAARFGPTAVQVAAVRASLRAHGLSPGPLTANGLAIPVSTTAAQVERAFSVSLARVALPQGRRAVVASAPPAIDTRVAGEVQAVVGLNSVSARPLLARPVLRPAGARPAAAARPNVVTGGPQPCAQASTAASQQGAYTADQIASAYRFSDLYVAGDQGQGQTIAVYELESNDPADIAAYQSCYGTSASISYIQVDGGAGSGPGSGEAALDIENLIGLAPRATLRVYQGPNASQTTPGSGPYDLFNAIVDDDRAQVVSVSWGQCEQLQGTSPMEAEGTLFEEAAIQGQSIVAATGDEGSEDCNQANGGVPDPELAVDDPGSQPFVTGVGGTSLGALGPPPSESVWNSGGNPTSLVATEGGAGGGGVSQIWRMPGYQSGAPASLNVIRGGSSGSSCGAASGFCRQVPDVAADADPNTGYIVYWNGSGSVLDAPSGWQAVGGTSAAAPLWAALLADVNASSSCRGSPIGFANPALYRAAASAYGSDFNDATVGNNDLTGTNGGLYPAGVAYDMATGLGSPQVGALAGVLCADALRVEDPGAQTSTVGQRVSLQVLTTAPPGSRLAYAAVQLPPGLSISTTTGRISGRPRRAGRFTVLVTALDQSLALRGVVFSWTVHGHPTISHESLSGVGRGRPSLALTVSAARGAPALTSVSIGLTGGLRFGGARGPVKLTGAGGRRIAFSSHVIRGRLVLSLRAPAGRISLTVSYNLLTASASLAGRVRGNHRRALKVLIATTDASHGTATTLVRIRPRN
jgi:subtilase family serine protease